MRRVEDSTLAAQVHEALLARGSTVATAESLNGGGVGRLLSSVAGSSATYRGGVVSYATDVKVSLLGVAEDLVATHGVVSAACAEQMAVGVRALLRSDWAVSTTGVAGPTLQEGKPAGTVHLGVAGPDGVRSIGLELEGDRESVRAGTEQAALTALLDRVLATDVGAGD
ncbi:CinA family protein [soil metagenome]